MISLTDVWFWWQVWAVNSAGRSASVWTNGRTGPAPPEGVGQPVFLRVSATSAVVDIRPPTRPNGIVSLYRVLSLNHNNRTLVKNIILLSAIHLTYVKVLVWFCYCLPFLSSVFYNYSLPLLWPVTPSCPTHCMFLNTMVTQNLNSPPHFPLPVVVRGYIPPADSPWFTSLHPVLGRSRGLHLLSGNSTKNGAL